MKPLFPRSLLKPVRSVVINHIDANYSLTDLYMKEAWFYRVLHLQVELA